MNTDFNYTVIRYTKASEDICAGLELCELHGLAPLRWPGTDDPISECLPQNVKVFQY